MARRKNTIFVFYRILDTNSKHYKVDTTAMIEETRKLPTCTLYISFVAPLKKSLLSILLPFTLLDNLTQVKLRTWLPTLVSFAKSTAYNVEW